MTNDELLAQLRHAEELVADLDGEPLQQVTGALRAARASFEQLLVTRTGELQRLGTAIECAAESIVITAADGSIGYVNPAFEAVTGYSRAEVLGKQPNILKSGRHDQAFYQQMWDTLLAGGVWQGRITNRKKDGALYEEWATISPIRDSGGAITGFVGVKRDITRETLLEAQLLQAQKMEAVGRLAGGVAHDFNNLLTVINGYSDLALSKLPEHDPIRGYLTEIRGAGERAASLTRQLLAFSRRQSASPRLLNLTGVVEAAARMFARMTGGQSSIKLHLAERALPVLADESQLHQVLMNLVTNSLDAMPRGGTIEISTAEATSAELTLRGRQGPVRFTRLSVCDTGDGMSKETIAHIFEPFFTTKDIGKGTGLGLAMVQGIVEQCGGWVEVDSKLGCGTRFDIFLPLARPDVTAAGNDAAQSCGHLRGQETILVVDDQDEVRRFVTAALRHFGYLILEANGSRDAVRKADDWKGPIDLLVTDVMMPGINGRELAVLLRRTRPEMRVLYVSGHAAGVPVDSTDDAAAFMHKPFTADVLAERVRRILR